MAFHKSELSMDKEKGGEEDLCEESSSASASTLTSVKKRKLSI